MTARRSKGDGSRVIRAAVAAYDPARTCIVGGDPLDGAGEAPTIILEREDDRIVRIVVKCVCGRSAELLCEYEEGVEQP